eukprot:2809586-Rhodomonas_salina.1
MAVSGTEPQAECVAAAFNARFTPTRLVATGSLRLRLSSMPRVFNFILQQASHGFKVVDLPPQALRLTRLSHGHGCSPPSPNLNLNLKPYHVRPRLPPSGSLPCLCHPRQRE